MDAVAMRLLEIGEAVKGISPELAATEPEIQRQAKLDLKWLQSAFGAWVTPHP